MLQVRPCLRLVESLLPRSVAVASHRVLQLNLATGQSSVPRWWLAPCVVAATVLAQGKVQCEESKTHKQLGLWRQDSSRSDSLAPFLGGLGVPRFAVFLVDAIRTDLDISCAGNELTVIDKTLFGKNTNAMTLGGEETECSTKTGRKKFMLSGFEDAEGRLTVQCRLFQRGEGWFTRQSWAVLPDGTLEEQMILQRPDQENVVVTRIFTRIGEARRPGDKEESELLDNSSSNGDRIGLSSAVLTVGGVGLVLLGGLMFGLIAWPKDRPQ